MPIREHLYKAKRKDNGEWVKGFFSMMTKGAYLDPIENGCYITTFEKLKNGEIILSKIFEVIPETVCEYTGRKDDNGTKVFEGDICKTKKGQIFLVAWSSPLLEFIWSIKRGDNSHLWNSGSLCTVCHFEVIGNIFDNPELLEVES